MANKALLVGINKYPGSPLNGCVNDIKNMAEFLVAKKYFEVEEIRVLSDERATTKNILERLEWLVTGLKSGDKCFFHFSGHGAQVPCRNGDGDVDNLNETICPVDFDWEPEHMIIDKQFSSIFKRIPEGVIFNWFSDCCNSGDLTRSIGFTAIPRCYPNAPFDIQWRGIVAKKKQIKCQSKVMINDVLDVGYISGCKDHQTSADTVMNGSPCGAFTFFLIKTLIDHPDLPLSKIGQEVCLNLKKNGFSQEPETEGARRDKPFLK